MIHLTKKAFQVPSRRAPVIVPIDPRTECATAICDQLYTRLLRCGPSVKKIRQRTKHGYLVGARRLSITRVVLGIVARMRTITSMPQLQTRALSLNLILI